jgi:small subunit ribosomal protein S15
MAAAGHKSNQRASLSSFRQLLAGVRRGGVSGDRAMAITKEKKTELISQFRRDDRDSGSPEVQVALLTARINYLTEHMRTHKKDFSSRRGLLKLVSQRADLLKYLRETNRELYLSIIGKLGLRK